VTLYEIEFRPEAAAEGRRLPPRIQIALREKLEYLRSAPFRSYPWLRVKELGDIRGVWRFHLDRWRVFYRVEGTRIIVGMIELRDSAYTHKARRKLRMRR
jgi:mRNA-degrading endonuclease RelE of RelBE toxin-antitoxin system